MGKSRNSKLCILCRKDINDEVKYGPLYKSKNVWVHYYCLLLSETITQSGQDEQGILGFLPSDITKEVERSKYRKCCYCNETMATLGCVHRHCNRKFHLYCGYLHDAMFHFNKFTAHCNLHTKPSNLPLYIKRSLKEYYCLICLDTFNENTKPSEVYWASCCKSRVVLHISCLRQMALSAGYFTKCPGCNNNTDFIESIKVWGVFVPERDASWELDRNAFSDLLYVHDTCDVLNCICPDGRSFSEDKGKWNLLLCKMCGSFGAHMACSEYKRRFLCDVCTLKEDTTRNLELQSNDCDSKNFETINSNEEEFIEIEILEPEYAAFFSTNENCENTASLVNSTIVEADDVSERLADERNQRKRSIQDITNSNNNGLYSNFHKELKESNNAAAGVGENLLTSIIKMEDKEQLDLTETLEIEGTSQNISLDDNSEVEFVSYTKLSTPPKLSLYPSNVELFLKSVISKPSCLQKRIFQKNCKTPSKVKKKKSKLRSKCSSIDKKVQLSLEQFITITKVS